MLRKALAVVGVLVLLAVPLVGRWLYYYQGRYQSSQVPHPDLASVEAPTPELPTFVDQPSSPTAAAGAIVVDLVHDNRFSMAELNVLQSRLAARGRQLEPVAAAEELAGRLRYAQALVIISPGTSLTADEMQLIGTFVDKGGRLLLVADPTRYGVLLDDYGNYVGMDSDATHLNDLAAQFGLIVQSDYLYNTVENEGNYRNIRLTQMADQALTAGLKQVVFYAAHSLISEQPALIAASGDTRSSSSARAGDLPVAALVADGAVLALGDLTFMTEPYNAVYDNDRLVSNIADFLSGAERRYDLADFPFFFRDEVDLVYAGDPALDSDLIRGGSSLQALFADWGKTLTVREIEDQDRDTLFFGLYREAGEVEPYLAAAGMTLTLTSTQTITSELLGITVDITPGDEVTATAEVEPLGQVVLSGTATLLLQRAGERHTLVVLATTEAGLANAVERLGKGDLAGCVLQESDAPPSTVLALCPTGEVAAGKGSGGWAVPTSAPIITPTIQPVGSKEQIVIVALDDTEGRYDSQTSADDYVAILHKDYEVSVWSEAEKGLPSIDLLGDCALVIWTCGDFAKPFGEAESALLSALMFKEIPMIASGAYLDDEASQAVQRDVRIEDAGHPVTKGFAKDQVIAFVSAPSDQEYAVNLLQEGAVEDANVLLSRGPASESPGAPSVLVLQEDFSGLKLLYIGFPLYLLPEEAKTRLVLNAVTWMLSRSE
jgi:hypothetical protein